MANVRRKDTIFIQDSTENPSVWWAQLQLMDDALMRASAESMTFVIPDYLWGRQHTKDRPHVPISAKKVGDSLKYVTRIITMDTHAKEIQGFINCSMDVLQSFPAIIKYLKSSDSITGESISELFKLENHLG